MDLIDRQAAIDALAEWEATRVWDDWCYDHKNEAEKYHITAPSAVVKALPPAQPHTDAEIQKMQELVAVQIEKAYELGRESAQSEQRWIPCSERLPDKNGKYLVVGRQKAINILKFDGGRWYGKWGVVAWMPLPEPYREERTEE